jgi:hypothetical protein
MKIRHLALLVCVCQLLQLGLNFLAPQFMFSGIGGIIRLTLALPLPLFFFFVWKRGKDA